MNINTTNQNNEYLRNIYTSINTIIKQADFDKQIKEVFNSNNHQLFDLWIKKTLQGINEKERSQKIEKLFENIKP